MKDGLQETGAPAVPRDIEGPGQFQASDTLPVSPTAVCKVVTLCGQHLLKETLSLSDGPWRHRDLLDAHLAVKIVKDKIPHTSLSFLYIILTEIIFSKVYFFR